MLVLRDITELKRAAEERVRMLSVQSARAEAEAANRAKDRFMANLSHELLHTPCPGSRFAVTAMLGEPTTPESLRTVLEMIRRNISLEARLIDDLLDLARIRRGALHLKREVTDAHEMINHVLAICDDDFRRAALELSVDLRAADSHIDADPIRFQQALWNLIKNAINSHPLRRRQIRVSSRNTEPEFRNGDLSALLIEVSDTGIGIEPEDMQRIFDVAEQGGTAATRRFGGLGLGLTLSRSIVEQQGGKLSASSAGSGMGTTFCIEMPSVPAPVSLVPLPDPVAAPEASPRRNVRILLVDDNADTLRFLSTILARRGHVVVTADDMASALKTAFEADLDLLISDIELPDGSGLELMDAIRTRRPIPGIALSGFGSADDIEQSLAAGFAIHLTKPVDFRRLEEVIQQIAAGGQAEDLVTG